MFKSIKRLLSALMAATMVSSFAVLPVSAADEIEGWNIQYNNNVDATVSIDKTDAAVGSSSMKVVNRSPVTANVYVMPKASINLVAGKKYTISAEVKSKNSSSVYFCITSGWDTTSITSIGANFEWTHFQYTYTATKTGANSLGLIVDGPSDGIWFDDVKVIDQETGKNLIANSGFETDTVAVPPSDTSNDTANGDMLEIYNKIKTSEKFTVDEMEQVRGAFKYMPVYKAENITIDGDMSDWDNYPSLHMPVLQTQYQVYLDDGKPKDVEAECKFAQDEENFYFAIAVKDDNYVYFSGEDQYWQGDSIQLTLSTPDESYGNELGFVHNAETGEGEIYGSGFNAEQKSLMTLKTSQKDGVTYYEFKFPWAIKYWGTRPTTLLFDFLINDNDGYGRRYCTELAPGISEGKSNLQFPTLEILGGKKDWYSWYQGDRTALTGDETKYEYYIVNEGDEKTFTLTNSINGETEEIVIPAKSGIRRVYSTAYEKAGVYTETAEVTCDGETVKSEFSKTIEQKPPTVEEAQAVIKKLQSHAKELKTLLDKCEKKGIPTDYETMDYCIIDQFIGYVEEDIKNDDLSRLYYTEETTDQLFEESKAALEEYLAKKKDPFIVPHYRTSEMKMDGLSTIATAEVDGKEEERPVFYVGYGHFGTSREYIPKFYKYGVNTVQTEIGPSDAMTSGWTFEAFNSPSYEMIQNGDVKKNGEKSLGFIYNSVTVPNQYITVYQNVPATPGKTYVFKGWIKSDSSSNYWVSPDGWNAPKYMNGTNDWQEFSMEYTCPENRNSINIRICIDNISKGLYFDNFSVKEKGSDVELLKNGDFEYGFLDLEAMNLDKNSNSFKTLINTLESAEENNVAVSVILAAHYFNASVAKANGFDIKTSGFLNYNVNHPMARDLIEKFLRQVVPEIKDYESVNNICISNEPQFQVKDCGDFYIEDWNKYLSEVYGGDINELNKVYGTNYTAFEGIDFEYDKVDIAKQWDYKIFNDKVFADWHKWMTDIIHEIAPDIPVISKPMGYVSSSNARAILLNNGSGYGEYEDFFDMHGSDYWNYYDDSFKPLVKEMWYDYQISFGKLRPAINTEDHVIADRNSNYNLEHSDYVAQDIWQGALHGRANTVMWVWQRYAKGGSTDFIGSVLYRPDAISKVGDVAFDLNRLAYEVTAVQNQEREIGIIYSDPSMLNSTNSMAAAYEVYAAAAFNGKRSIFISDYNMDKINDCKMIVVPEVQYITADLLNAIKKYIENGGKVIVLGDNMLKLDEHNQPNDDATVNYILSNSKVVSTVAIPTGYTSPTSSELCELLRNELKSENLYNVSVIDTATGKPAENVEYNVGVYDGKLLVNLSNFDEEKTLKIYAGDKPVTEAVELRSGEELGDEVTVGKYQIAFLRTNITNPFIDTYGHWAEDEIVSLKDKNVVNGVTDSKFCPDGNITRAEFLALLTRASDFDEVRYSGGIADVKAEDWFAGNVAVALSKGIIGKDDFRPNDKITREEMCEMLVACKEATDGALTKTTDLSFTDSDEIVNKDVVAKAVAAGLMQGNDNGSFAPKGNATRAEASAVVNRYLTK